MDGPKIIVVCRNQYCDRFEVQALVNSGTIVGDNVLAIFTKFTCGTCGYDMQPVANDPAIRSATAEARQQEISDAQAAASEESGDGT